MCAPGAKVSTPTDCIAPDIIFHGGRRVGNSQFWKTLSASRADTFKRGFVVSHMADQMIGCTKRCH